MLNSISLTQYRITVLLVDDQAMVGEAVRHILADEKDIDFHYCQNPIQAVKQANKIRPTIILQDLVMPDIDGLVLVRYFRANKPTRNVPLLVLSSKEDPGTKAEAFALGANDYLVKLPDKLEFIARIRYHSRAYINLLQKNEAYNKLKQLKESLEVENYELMVELGQAFESFVRTLATTIDAKHPLTAGHAYRVTEYSQFLGRKLKLSKDELEVLKYAALLHDIGKIGVPDAILTKKGQFTPEERCIMNEHTTWTYRILKDMQLPQSLKDIPRIAACHHEKIDGTGYPYGLQGTDIPFFSRILAVADVFDALSSRRDYPKYDQDKLLGFNPMSIERVFTIIERDQNSHFDSDVIAVALENRAELEALLHKLQQDV